MTAALPQLLGLVAMFGASCATVTWLVVRWLRERRAARLVGRVIELRPRGRS